MVAVLYTKDGYDTTSKRLMGRHAAGEGFLKALVRYSNTPDLYCYTATKQDYEDFCQRVTPWLTGSRTGSRKVTWIASSQPSFLSQAGVLYRPDPLISGLAWQRRYRDERGYSLCGITHTLASKETVDGIAQWLTSPLYPWDAIICTSSVVKESISRVLAGWGEFLGQRFGVKEVMLQPHLPVIPLGVDCSAFWQTPETRAQVRQQLGIPQEDIVVLFVGRLVFNAKAHPVPMYMAIARAAEAAGVKVHLIQSGWFEEEKQEKSFYEGAEKFGAGVRHVFLDGRQPNTRQHIWAVADVFISLSDNVQETFGLTPIEAMASGLPVVVSDWNGYKETVRDGIDGFRIPTILPPAGCGMDLAANYWEDSLNYSTTIGLASLMTAVDVDKCSEVLTRLFREPELRSRMGESGKAHAKAMFDWAVVIEQYENLWAELNERRLRSPAMPKPKVPHPLCDDPFRLHSHYPTEVLSLEHRVALGGMANPESIQKIQGTWFTNFGSDRRLAGDVVEKILAELSRQESLTVADLIQQFTSGETGMQFLMCRTITYLLKFNVLKLV